MQREPIHNGVSTSPRVTLTRFAVWPTTGNHLPLQREGVGYRHPVQSSNFKPILPFWFGLAWDTVLGTVLLVISHFCTSWF
jgi:hypothetical protein